MHRYLMSTTFLLSCFCAGLCQAADDPRGAYAIELDKEAEVSMALSAAPPHIRSKAGVYVLGPAGFVQYRQSENGFNCLVERDGARILAPICYDQEGSQTTMRAVFRTAELVRSGKSLDAALKQRDAEVASGQLGPPQKPGIAYMLSRDFCEIDPETGERKQIYPPHLMFYAPYMKNEDIGAAKETVGSLEHPWILNEGSPFAYIIVVPKE